MTLVAKLKSLLYRRKLKQFGYPIYLAYLLLLIQLILILLSRLN